MQAPCMVGHAPFPRCLRLSSHRLLDILGSWAQQDYMRLSLPRLSLDTDQWCKMVSSPGTWFLTGQGNLTTHCVALFFSVFLRASFAGIQVEFDPLFVLRMFWTLLCKFSVSIPCFGWSQCPAVGTEDNGPKAPTRHKRKDLSYNRNDRS